MTCPVEVSVIIPALNEEQALPRTLTSLQGQQGWREAWVVDGGSRDGTLRVAEDFRQRDPRIQWMPAPRGRGAQMNAGARHSNGDVLLFLHADTVLARGALEALHESFARASPRAGCFTHHFSDPDLSLKLLSVAHNRRFDWTRIAYGDQALFVDRRLFWDIGGFPETELEDIRFGEKLRRATRLQRVPASVVTDSRKFRHLGTWRSVWYVLHILAAHKLGRPPPRSPFLQDHR